MPSNKTDISLLARLALFMLTAVAANYGTLRRHVFSLIYPALKVFKPNSREYLYYSEHFREIDSTVHHVSFDLHGNISDLSSLMRHIENPNKKFFQAVIVTNHPDNIYQSDKKFIIHVDGNATCFEQFRDKLGDLADEYANVIAFNPMGVGSSPGNTDGPEEYQAALASILKHLRHNNVSPENILILGRSLGAAMSLPVVAKYPGVKIVADRTFARLDDVAANMVSRLVPLSYYPTKLAIQSLGLQVNPAESFNKINTKNPGDAVGISTDEDSVIPGKVGLFHGVSQDMRNKGFVKNFVPRYMGGDPHNGSLRDLIDPETSSTAEDLVERYKHDFLRPGA